jgi:hypothetical protein
MFTWNSTNVERVCGVVCKTKSKMVLVNPLRPGKLFFEFVGTSIKRLILGANKQNRNFKVDIFYQCKDICIDMFLVILTVRIVGEIFS